MLQAEEILSKVTKEVVIEIMEENGSPLYAKSKDNRTGQECLWFRTICHGGDSHKLCYFTETKDFYCYTCCGRMTFFNFIKRIRDLGEDEFYQSILYVAGKVGINASSNRYGIGLNNMSRSIKEEIDLVENRKKIKAEDKKEVIMQIDKFYDDSILNYFDENTFYSGWINEGISIETMKKFGIRWYEFQKHIIIPHYNIDGKLVGIRRRSLRPEDKNNKYTPEYVEGKSYEHPLGLNLYGLYENKKAIEKSKIAYIVEGEKSVLLSNTYYGNKSVAIATCGFNVSKWQLQALLNLGVDKVYLCFDKDFDIKLESEYRKNEKVWKDYNRYLERLDMLGKRISEYFTGYIVRDRMGLLDIKDSPFDKGKEIFETLLKDAKKINKNEKVRDIMI